MFSRAQDSGAKKRAQTIARPDTRHPEALCTRSTPSRARVRARHRGFCVGLVKFPVSSQTTAEATKRWLRVFLHPRILYFPRIGLYAPLRHGTSPHSGGAEVSDLIARVLFVCSAAGLSATWSRDSRGCTPASPMCYGATGKTVSTQTGSR